MLLKLDKNFFHIRIYLNIYKHTYVYLYTKYVHINPYSLLFFVKLLFDTRKIIIIRKT